MRRRYPLPQSNQRGIETVILDNLGERVLVPQSNQRGIETRGGACRGIGLSSLNRTSVGLKQKRKDSLRGRTKWPQSNQRGIETRSLSLSRTSLWLASIEPAWD